MKIVVIGGVAGGASAAARLRRLDENAEIIMLDKGDYISFANCGLPYYVGGSIESGDALSVQTSASFNGRFNVDVRARSEVTGIDRAAKTITVHDLNKDTVYQESYDKLVYAPGAEPNVPAFVPKDSSRIFTVRTIPDAEKIRKHVILTKPRTAVIAGGGFIGLEMAENLMERGVEVTVIGRSSHVLNNIDTDVAWDVHNYLRSKGLHLMCGAAMSSVTESLRGIEIATSLGSVTADMLIVAVGVKPDTEIAVAAGLKCDAQGYVMVDERMQSSDPDIYAVGDAVSITDYISGERAHVALATPANHQARIAADQICGIDSRYKGCQRSFVIRLFDKTVAATGMTEKYARSLNIETEKVHLYQSNHAGYFPGAEMMAAKVIFDRNSGKILGGQFFGGAGVDKRADVLAVAIRAGMTASDLAELELCYAPPYNSAKDPVMMAGMAIENIMKGLVKVYHWENLDKLYGMDVTLLDVRTKREYEAGSVKGFINIPLHEIRSRCKELDPSKPIYVHCFSGMRSYVACRILTGLGFDCVNISGGYRLYTAMKEFSEAAAK